MSALIPAPPLERTHLARHDLDWLPTRFKALRWTTAGAIWSVMAGTAAGLLFLKTGVWMFYAWKGFAAFAAGGYYAGDRVARAMLRWRLAKLAHGQVDLQRLAQEADRTLAHVRGKVRARETVRGLLHEDQVGVFRRTVFHLEGFKRFVHETAVDFSLVDEAGEQVLIEAAGSHLVAPDASWVPISVHKLLALALPDAVRIAAQELATHRRTRDTKVSETLIHEGDSVEVIGYKGRDIDPTVADRMGRDAPLRPTLRSGKELPLLIAPIAPTPSPKVRPADR